MCYVATKPRLDQYPKITIGDYLALMTAGKTIRSAPQATTTTPCHFGGYRHWFICPSCSRRVGVLYFGDEPACNRCMRISYASQLSQPIEHTLARLDKVHQRLRWHDALKATPPKPKGMHQRTYQQLLTTRQTIIKQLIGQIMSLCNFKSPSQPRKPAHEYTLDDIFDELNRVKSFAAMTKNTHTMAMIPVIRARLLGLDKVRLERVQVEEIASLTD